MAVGLFYSYTEMCSVDNRPEYTRTGDHVHSSSELLLVTVQCMPSCPALIIGHTPDAYGLASVHMMQPYTLSSYVEFLGTVVIDNDITFMPACVSPDYFVS